MGTKKSITRTCFSENDRALSPEIDLNENLIDSCFQSMSLWKLEKERREREKHDEKPLLKYWDKSKLDTKNIYGSCCVTDFINRMGRKKNSIPNFEFELSYCEFCFYSTGLTMKDSKTSEKLNKCACESRPIILKLKMSWSVVDMKIFLHFLHFDFKEHDIFKKVEEEFTTESIHLNFEFPKFQF
jgi:hypothetical protein